MTTAVEIKLPSCSSVAVARKLATSAKQREVAEHLAACLSYNNATGEFVWIASNSKKASSLIGRRAGCVNVYGYVVIRFRKQLFMAHRLAWFMTFGKWPTAEIDHINRVKHDNRIANLREATREQNIANRVGGRGISGRKGVKLDKRDGVWTASFGDVHIGRFSDPDEAKAAYDVYVKKMRGEFACP